jgi:hypothetical protein
MVEQINRIVFNVTIKVRWEIAEGWLVWQKTQHIPAHLATGAFDSYSLFRLLEQDEDEGPTFIVQYFTSSPERYQEYLTAFAPALQRAAQEKWGDGFIAFRTLMEGLGQGGSGA